MTRAFERPLLGVLVALLTVLICSPKAQAEPLRLDGRLSAGRALGKSCDVFEDRTGRLNLAQVQRQRFTPSAQESPSFGYSRSAYWLRCNVHNPSAEAMVWFLEIAFPHLDEIALFSPRPSGGMNARFAGDLLPFAAREYDYRHFIFHMETAPGPQQYYLRIRSSGSLRVPLTAWSEQGFTASVDQRAAALWMFFGLMLAMVIYNLFILVATRDTRYLYYVLFITTNAILLFTLNGLAFQYLCPTSPAVANRLMPTFLALVVVTSLQFSRAFVETRTHFPRLDRLLGGVVLSACAIALTLAWVAPVTIGLLAASVLFPLTIIPFVPLAASLALRGQRQARYWLAAWSILLLGILMNVVMSLGLLPLNHVTEWSAQIGSALEVLLLALGLADRINVMRRDLQTLNNELARNVTTLTTALQAAEAAGKAKSAFLAGVSHELRTPLNAIINIPEGLIDDFKTMERAHCPACGSTFELEPGETVDASAPCPECQTTDLRIASGPGYTGDAAHTRLHLEQVIRSGQHLLNVVTDILDMSKSEAGHMTIHLQPVQLGPLLEDAIAPMKALAQNQGVTLCYSAPVEALYVDADPPKLKQIVLNLVGNAIKFSDGKGSVDVQLWAEGESCVIGVYDQGIGIPADQQGKLFQAFTQVGSSENRRFGGTGLGLAISQMLVKAHSGEIWCESQIGHGSRFYVRFPLSQSTSRQASPSLSPRAASEEPSPMALPDAT